MNSEILLYSILILILLSTSLANRINLYSTTMKRTYLYINSKVSLSKNVYLYSLKIALYSILMYIAVVLIGNISDIDISILKFSTNENIFKCFIELIASLMININIFFLSNILIISILLNKNLNKIISDIKWIQCDDEYSIYTKIIRPILIGIVESIMYSCILIKLSIDVLNVDFFSSIIITALVYGICKALMMKDNTHKLVMLMFGFFIAMTGSLLYGVTENIIYTSLLYIFNISFWVFKR
ncbi:hypothetical protein QOZ84_01815 [Romboutsia sedimentorum]|uniref:Uncharacterized protein n=1 Tax=Romboutsia sedimentorum TaxID=1368474 RepID=A0ABT7E5R3_9FIRM|nr:hypothetical protein [Romboutsia sedimentorum]MDK2562269.1 hypothetical protein [Romboutsia sedimentorum]